MNPESITKDLSAMEQRYSDGHLESNSFWEVFFMEIKLLVLKYQDCKEINDSILALIEKLSKKMKAPPKRKSPYER